MRKLRRRHKSGNNEAMRLALGRSRGENRDPPTDVPASQLENECLCFQDPQQPCHPEARRSESDGRHVLGQGRSGHPMNGGTVCLEEMECSEPTA
jgi:hypothetical protein